jgi:hypothetical protein
MFYLAIINLEEECLLLERPNTVDEISTGQNTCSTLGPGFGYPH